MSSNKIHTVLGNIGLYLLFFWVSYSFLVGWVAAEGYTFSFSEIIVYNIFYSLLMMSVPIVNQLYLFHRFLVNQKYWAYALYVTLLMGMCSFFFVGLDALFLSDVSPEWLYSIWHFLIRMPYQLILVLITNWFGMVSQMHIRRLNEEKLVKLQAQTELKWLLVQLNPHFLFNTINNIHSLIQLNSAKASPALVKLSELLRYVIYYGEKEFVSIAQEIVHIQNFLELSIMKERWKPKIKFNYKSSDDKLQVPPLFLINFVENAIKHGNLDDDEAYLNIKLSTTSDTLEFLVENTFKIHTNKDKTIGIGLENIKKRLQIIYPESHKLSITNVNNVYGVQLKIENIDAYNP